MRSLLVYLLLPSFIATHNKHNIIQSVAKERTLDEYLVKSDRIPRRRR
ncbi:hypothetical protein [Aerosakkonema funiforme]|nr:hypothetical protein [Aerosakkonema funiforme]